MFTHISLKETTSESLMKFEVKRKLSKRSLRANAVSPQTDKGYLRDIFKE